MLDPREARVVSTQCGHGSYQAQSICLIRVGMNIEELPALRLGSISYFFFPLHAIKP